MPMQSVGCASTATAQVDDWNERSAELSPRNTLHIRLDFKNAQQPLRSRNQHDDKKQTDEAHKHAGRT